MTAAPAPQISRKSSWTPERRARQAAAIRNWAPWKKSTGPKTAAGKARAAQNAARPELDSIRVMERALRDHGRYLLEINLYIRLKETPSKNELLKRQLYNLQRRLHRRGHKVLNRLQHAFLYEQLSMAAVLPPETCRNRSYDWLQQSP